MGLYLNALARASSALGGVVIKGRALILQHRPLRMPQRHPQRIERNSPLPAARTILVVDDDDDLRVTMSWFLTSCGFTVESAGSAEKALALFDPQTHDIVVTDNSMPGMSGAEMAHIIKLRSPATPILMYTGQLPKDRSCLDLVLQRPAHLLTLKDAVDMLLVRRTK